MFSSHEFIYIFIGDHATIADEHNAAEMKSLVQIADDLLHGFMVHGVAGPDMMSDRPASHHDDADDDLHVLGLSSRLWPCLAKLAGPAPSKYVLVMS